MDDWRWRFILTLTLLLANLAITKLCKKKLKVTETLPHGYSTWVLSEGYPMHTNMIGFGWFSKFLSPCALDEINLSIGRVNPDMLKTFHCWGYFLPKHKNAKIFGKHLSPKCWYSLDCSHWVLCVLVLWTNGGSLSIGRVLPLLRLQSSKALGRKYHWKPSKLCHSWYLLDSSHRVPMCQGFS